MGTKKVAYTTLLKEALADNVSEFDTTKTIDSTGPMTKQILSYKGDGELKTTSDAASVLERYYFKDTDGGVEQVEEGHLGNELDAEPKDVNKSKKDMEKDIVEAEEKEDPEKKDDEDGEEEKVEEGAVQEGDELTEAEEAVIERLISEMEGEEESEEDEDKEEKVEEGKKAVKEEDDEGGEEELNVDDEMGDAGEEEVKEAALGPLGHPNDAESYENLEEAFKIFREEIEDDTVVIDDEDDVQV